MTIEQNKTVYRRFIQEVFNEGKLAVLQELVAPSYVLHDAPPGAPPGAQAIAHVVETFRAGLPDLVITLDELVAEGEMVCSRATTRGTHRGAFFGLAPTQRKVAIVGLTMVRIVDGRIVESWVRNDVAGLMRQLGAPPAA